jgi:hypothetical protein
VIYWNRSQVVIMKKGLVITLCLSLIATAMVIPAPSGALLYDMDQSLSSVDASFIGEDTGDNAGSSVAAAGDVDGDGYDDFLIGAKFDSTAGNEAGMVYLVRGKPEGWSMDTDLSNVNISFKGENARDQAGIAIDGVGDVNNDGYDDFLIGAWGDDDGGSWAGQTYLFLGKSSGWTSNTNVSKANASYWGEDAGDCSGFAVAGAGDVNGDGYDDFLIGAYGASTGSTSDTGQAYLIFGKASGWSMDTDLSNADASFIGKNQYDSVGYDLAGAGDVNGDGYDDILLGAPFDDDGAGDAGVTFLFLGKPSGWAMDTKVATADASFLGEAASDESGYSISGAGDVNGDGYDDFIIGARENDAGADRAGQAYLIFGKASGWAMNTSLSDANASFLGENEDDVAGWDVAGVGDVDRDGYDDILIGAPGNDEEDDSAGQSYIVLGKSSGWSMDVNLSGANASFFGERSDEFSGMAVSDAGDVDGDGYDDVLIGVYTNNDGLSDHGGHDQKAHGHKSRQSLHGRDLLGRGIDGADERYRVHRAQRNGRGPQLQGCGPRQGHLQHLRHDRFQAPADRDRPQHWDVPGQYHGQGYYRSSEKMDQGLQRRDRQCDLRAKHHKDGLDPCGGPYQDLAHQRHDRCNGRCAL